MTSSRFWRVVHELAAVAGVDPWGYTLRELVWRAEAVRQEAWEHTAHVIAALLSVMGGEAVAPDDVNPYKLSKLPPEPKMSVADTEFLFH